MATYRQIPEVFRRLHPRFKTPWLSLVLFAGVAPIAVILPGDVNFVGTLYSFGATLSFTVAHASIVRLRMRPATEDELLYRARPSLRVGGDRLAALRDLRRARDRRSRSLVILVQNPTHALGRARLDRRRPRRLRALPPPGRARAAARDGQGAAGLRARARARVPAPARARCSPGQASDDALDVAASLAAERGAQIAAVHVLEIPLELPLATELPERGGAREPRARRGARDRRLVRRRR